MVGLRSQRPQVRILYRASSQVVDATPERGAREGGEQLLPGCPSDLLPSCEFLAAPSEALAAIPANATSVMHQADCGSMTVIHFDSTNGSKTCRFSLSSIDTPPIRFLARRRTGRRMGRAPREAAPPPCARRPSPRLERTAPTPGR